jgi:hypothetical protein
MTMHIEGPWLNTTGKKKGKQKFRNAEQARRARENEESWKELKAKWGAEDENRKQQRAMKAAPLGKSYSLSIPAHRSTAHIPSKDSGVGVAAAPEAKVYTGTAMRGIGQMHKSNAVPIFSDEEAVAIAHMRR